MERFPSEFEVNANYIFYVLAILFFHLGQAYIPFASFSIHILLFYAIYVEVGQIISLCERDIWVKLMLVLMVTH